MQYQIQQRKDVALIFFNNFYNTGITDKKR